MIKKNKKNKKVRNLGRWQYVNSWTPKQAIAMLIQREDLRADVPQELEQYSKHISAAYYMLRL